MSPAWLGSPPESFGCLAIETSTRVSSIAACHGGRVAEAEYGAPGRESRLVYACVRDVLREVGASLQALDCVAFGCGPGGFTGLRVGAAVAQALAYGAGLPVCRVSSLATLAAGAMRRHEVGCVAACVDARMGEAYLGVYRDTGDGLRAERADCLVAPDEFLLPPSGELFAAGPGWAAFPGLAAAHASTLTGTDSDVVPTAQVLLALAAREYPAGRTVPPHEAVPNYVRDRVTS